MARARPRHQAQRAITELTVGVAKAVAARNSSRALLGLNEMVQQYQVAISGSTGTTVGFQTATVTFDFPFYYAPGQRDSDLDHPHFTFGAEINVNAIVSAVVTAWTMDSQRGGYTGATIVIGVLGAAVATFTGSVHLAFQGLAAVDDVEATTLES